MSAEVVAGHALWLIEHRKTATEEAFIERLSELIAHAVDVVGAPPGRRARDPLKRAEFLLAYQEQRGHAPKPPYGLLSRLCRSFDVPAPTAHAWLRAARLA